MALKYLRLLAAFLALTSLALSAQAAQHRSYHAIKQFKLDNPCPANGRYKGRCPGYVIDHVKALACGGLDSPKNMQWQTVEEAKQKDKWERQGC
jgi:hypothetical protein